MKRKVVQFSVALIIISVVITTVLSIKSNIKSFVEEKDSELLNYCKLINNTIEEDYDQNITPDLSYYAKIFSESTGQRITFIDPKGVVLGDSMAGDDYKNLSNHLERKEVQESLKTGEGMSNRQSKSFKESFLYVAAALNQNDETVLITRVAMEINSLQIIRNFIIKSTLLYAAVGTIVAVLIGMFYAGKLMKPVYEMEKQLEITMEENRKAENIRKEFVANVTHELKTPLTSISGFVETLQDGAAEDPEVRTKFLDIIAIEAARLKRLIEDILIISDIENKREVNTNSDINVREAIEETITTIMPIVDAKGVTVKTDFAYEIYIGGNYDRFKQLMMNLIENAVKYSYDGGVVTVTACKIDGKVRVSVKDEGIGIAEENIPRLFERFYRVDKSRSHKVGGTGLGLAIVKHIAALFEAEIKVESKLGQGSTFTVIFKN
ncbi:sensor histidine kinase [Anaerovorax odorimutans]|uniref:sensor histidine kinase n=1 Tax=Anaerovorax odorimutans TaxID=109327 RepID=UPI00041EB703|nr:ATP-binding protein [Anaerovorax odorimutans]